MTIRTVVPVRGTERGTTAADRVCDVLLLLMDSPAPLGVSEVASGLGLAKSVTHRILRSLASRNLVEQPPGSAAYRLGPAAVAIGVTALNRSELENVAAPYLRELRDVTQETALLSRPVAGGRVHVAQCESPRNVRMTVELGVFRPWHAGASGKILLAYAEPEFRERAIALEAELYRLSPESITALNDELEQARADGYAISSGERNPDAGAIAAPVFGHRDAVIGAISICGPLSRFGPEESIRFAPQLLSTTRRVSARVADSAR